LVVLLACSVLPLMPLDMHRIALSVIASAAMASNW